jgi:hypothetical protein
MPRRFFLAAPFALFLAFAGSVASAQEAPPSEAEQPAMGEAPAEAFAPIAAPGEDSVEADPRASEGVVVEVEVAEASAAPPPPTAPPQAPASWLERPLFRPYRWLALRGVAELGTLGVLAHTIQFGSDGTELDYVREGGQDNLFLFARISAEAELFSRHKIILLYQPLDVQTTALLRRDVVIDDQLFPSGTPMSFRYGFDFVRASYLFDFFADEGTELAVGLSFQVRNATIDFASQDGTLFRGRRDIGPVPILKARGRYTFSGGFFTGFEADAFWASGRFITGTTNDFEGAIYDVSLRAGVPLTGFASTFVNLRYLGGGARGVEEDRPGPGDGFTENWLHTLSLSLGFELF